MLFKSPQETSEQHFFYTLYNQSFLNNPITYYHIRSYNKKIGLKMQGFFNYPLPVSLHYYKKSDENPCIFLKRKKVWLNFFPYFPAQSYLNIINLTPQAYFLETCTRLTGENLATSTIFRKKVCLWRFLMTYSVAPT